MVAAVAAVAAGEAAWRLQTLVAATAPHAAVADAEDAQPHQGDEHDDRQDPVQAVVAEGEQHLPDASRLRERAAQAQVRRGCRRRIAPRRRRCASAVDAHLAVADRE